MYIYILRISNIYIYILRISNDKTSSYPCTRDFLLKELSLCNKIKYLTPNIFSTRWCKLLIFQTQITWFNRIHSLKYPRSTTFGSKDIVIIKSEFVAETQFLYVVNSSLLESWLISRKLSEHWFWASEIHSK